MKERPKNASIEPYTCQADGECVNDADGTSTLTKHACQAGCQPNEIASHYWKIASLFVEHAIQTQEPSNVDGIQSYTHFDANFFVRNHEDPLELNVFCGIEKGKQNVYYFHFYRVEEKDPLRSFEVDVSVPGYVHVVSENFFTCTSYNARKDKFAVEHFFFLLDFVAIGFCQEKDKLKIDLKDEWRTKRKATSEVLSYEVDLESFWILLGRGYTYGVRSKRCIKAQALATVGTLQCTETKTVLDVARLLFEAKTSDETMHVLATLFSVEEPLNKKTGRLLMHHFDACIKRIHASPEFKAYDTERYYTKCIDCVNVDAMRHMVFYDEVEYA